jgi:hypothetical protein
LAILYALAIASILCHQYDTLPISLSLFTHVKRLAQSRTLPTMNQHDPQRDEAQNKLIGLYQAVEAAVSRQQVKEILRQHEAYRNQQQCTDR